MLGDITFDGEEASTLTQVKGTKLRAVYLRHREDRVGPPLELLHFIEPAGEEGVPYARLTNPGGITEVAFWVKDIEKRYEELRAQGVEFYSASQLFEIEGYGRAKVVYFRDPDGTTLEMMQGL